MAAEEVPRDEAQAALSARRDLGQEYEPEIVDSFVERIDKAIDERVSEAVERRSGKAWKSKDLSKAAEMHMKFSLSLAIVSLCLSVPLTAVVAGVGLEAILLVWVAIVIVNVAYNLGNRPKG